MYISSWFGEKCVAMAMLYKDSKRLPWGARISPCTTTNNLSFHNFSTSKVDVSKAKTKIQIRFHDGTRKAQEFNEDRGIRFLLHHLSQLSAFIPFMLFDLN